MIEAVSSKPVIAPRCLNFCLTMTYKEGKEPRCLFLAFFSDCIMEKMIWSFYFFFIIFMLFSYELCRELSRTVILHWWLLREWTGTITVVTARWIPQKGFKFTLLKIRLCSVVSSACLYQHFMWENALYETVNLSFLINTAKLKPNILSTNTSHFSSRKRNP